MLYQPILTPNDQLIIYKLSQFDLLTNNKIMYSTRDESVSVSIYTGGLPLGTRLISIRTPPIEFQITRVEEFILDKWFVASQNYLDVNIHYANFTVHDSNILYSEPVMEMKFGLSSVFKEINKARSNSIVPKYRCISRMASKFPFEINKEDPYL